MDNPVTENSNLSPLPLSVSKWQRACLHLFRDESNDEDEHEVKRRRRDIIEESEG